MRNAIWNSVPAGITGNLSSLLTFKRLFQTNYIRSIIPSPADHVVYVRRRLSDDIVRCVTKGFID